MEKFQHGLMLMQECSRLDSIVFAILDMTMQMNYCLELSLY